MSTLKSARFFTRLTTAAVLLASVGLPALARAQSKPSLATVAREESERRKTTKEAKKVITAKDLPESAQRPATRQPEPGCRWGSGAGSRGWCRAQAPQRQILPPGPRKKATPRLRTTRGAKPTGTLAWRRRAKT